MSATNRTPEKRTGTQGTMSPNPRQAKRRLLSQAVLQKINQLEQEKIKVSNDGLVELNEELLQKTAAVSYARDFRGKVPRLKGRASGPIHFVGDPSHSRYGTGIRGVPVPSMTNVDEPFS